MGKRICKRKCTCCKEISNCFRFRNNIDLCGDCQYYIYKAICHKSNRFPGNPPNKLIDTICKHCQLLDPCLELLDNYCLCDACMFEQVDNDTLEYN